MASVNMAHARISWMHRTGGYWDPTHDPVYRRVLEGVRRQQVEHLVVHHKRPITAAMIGRIHNVMIQGDGTIRLPDYRLLLFIISYSGFLRFQEAFVGPISPIVIPI